MPQGNHRNGLLSLSPRERQVLDQLMQGRRNQEIGRALGISPRTVEIYRHGIMHKLDARNLVELARKVLAEHADGVP